MLKGDIEIVTVPLSAVLFVGVILGIIGFVGAYLLHFTATLEESEKDLDAIDASHIIERCLTGGNQYISVNFLNAMENKNICEIKECMLCGKIGFRIEDMQGDFNGKNTWNFYYDGDGKHTHEIFVNIGDGKDVHVGKLYVEVKE